MAGGTALMPPPQPNKTDRAILRHLAAGDRLVSRDRRRASWRLTEAGRRVRPGTLDRLIAGGWLVADARGRVGPRYILSEAGRDALANRRRPRRGTLARPASSEPPTPPERPAPSPPRRPERPARLAEARTVEAMFWETWHTMTDHEKDVARLFFEQERR
jgi:hypothetical protein